MQIRCSKSSCMEKENRLYSISLGVASFAGLVWSVSQLLYLLQRAGHFKFFSPSFFVGLELIKDNPPGSSPVRCLVRMRCHYRRSLILFHCHKRVTNFLRRCVL